MAQAAPTAVLVSKEGKVEVARQGATAWGIPETNAVLQVGDRLRTGLRSRAALQWSDRSVMRVDQLTTLELAAPAVDDGKAQLDLKSGATYLFSREKPMDLRFRTPVASGAIRGTEFALRVAQDGRLELSLIDGEVTLGNSVGELALTRGEQATVEPGKAPVRSPMLDAKAPIQWALYYPAVVFPGDLGLSAEAQKARAGSLEAYAAGDLARALSENPATPPSTDSERLYTAALLLSVGRADEAESALRDLPESGVKRAVAELVATVRGDVRGQLAEPATASEHLARSYTLQGRSDLAGALNQARAAVAKAPAFGAAHLREAELLFGLGNPRLAHAALESGLRLSPANGQGLALRGFLLAAQNQWIPARRAFEDAIAADSALANGWLGRGLARIHEGDRTGGRADLQTAAALEPQRSLLRSYLGKAFQQEGEAKLARKEIGLAQRLDPADPTPWLYSALLNQEANHINEAASDLERSKELNDNRSLFRSRLLLDQDQAVRSANLAAVYRDLGMLEVSMQEAATAVSSDYANPSAHQFLATSYDYLRDPYLVNLRYEAPAFSEYLVANLLMPAGGGPLAQNVSQQEYSRFFDTQGLGIYSSTEYRSRGDWLQSGSQYGYLGNMSYSMDVFYRSENGDQPNGKLEQLSFAGRYKQNLTERDSVYLEISTLDLKTGDVAQYYNPADANRTLHVKEQQVPNIMAGYHHEWSPGNHTLFFAGRFDDQFTLSDEDPSLLYLRTFESIFNPGVQTVTLSNPNFFTRSLDSHLVAYSTELQQVLQVKSHTIVAGARYQDGETDTHSVVTRTFGLSPQDMQNEVIENDLRRFSIYAYDTWQLLDNLHLTAGVTYDNLRYPVNPDLQPISGQEETEDQVSPKAGITWTPFKRTQLRAAYSQSLGGTFFDTSVRLEPTQLAGFNQAYRSIAPESVVGLVPATKFETLGVGLNQTFATHTYLFVDAQWLTSDALRTAGLLTNSLLFAPIPDSVSSTRQAVDYDEKTLAIALHQLLGNEWSVGVRYKLTYTDLTTEFVDIPSDVAGGFNQDVNSILNQLNFSLIYQHRCGFFALVEPVFYWQANHGYSGNLPGEQFWQLNLSAGYRFWQRRAEARISLLNALDEDYRLNPVVAYNALPRERLLTVNFKFNF